MKSKERKRKEKKEAPPPLLWNIPKCERAATLFGWKTILSTAPAAAKGRTAPFGIRNGGDGPLARPFLYARPPFFPCTNSFWLRPSSYSPPLIAAPGQQFSCQFFQWISVFFKIIFSWIVHVPWIRFVRRKTFLASTFSRLKKIALHSKPASVLLLRNRSFKWILKLSIIFLLCLFSVFESIG